MIDDTENTEASPELTEVTYEELLAELQEIEKQQSESIQIMSDIREQLNFSNTVNTYILCALLLYGVFKFLSRLLHSTLD